MKSSVYNISVPLEGGYLVYNSFSRGFLYLSTQVWRKHFLPDSTVNLSELNCDSIAILKENGFIVDADTDEYALALELKMMTRLQKRAYTIIVNPTLDCNLNCWYCYESHQKGSRISHQLIQSINKHIDWKFAEDHFEHLHLSFFGGEPMLGGQQIAQIIEYASNFCRDNNIRFDISFTTNGTILPSVVLNSLKGVDVAFQITLDGAKEQHNKVRHFKHRAQHSYDIIWRNIKRIQETLPSSQLCIRINFDSKTLTKTDELTQDLLQLDRRNITIALHKVWQEPIEAIDFEKVILFITTLQECGFKVSFLDFSRGETTCYADKINSVVINYDGSVYKCTARNFSHENSLGKLSSSGGLIWDYEKLKGYCFSKTPNKCQQCKLFPSCPGICSQKIIEEGDNAPCFINDPFSVEDYILYNYKLKTLQTS